MRGIERDPTFHLITGGSGSGKSAYAENCVSRLLDDMYDSDKIYPDSREESGQEANFHGILPARCVYIATMIPYGEDGRRRVERHRRLRREKNFETIECYTGLENLSLDMALHDINRKESTVTDTGLVETSPRCAVERRPETDYVVLLECMSNLVANEMFEPDGAGDGTVDAILRGIEAMRRQARHLVVVTNEVFSDGVSYDAETMRYLSCLGTVNQAMAAQADIVTEVVYGIPVTVKADQM